MTASIREGDMLGDWFGDSGPTAAFLRDLERDDVNEFDELTFGHEILRGESLYSERQVTDRLYVVRSGRIKLAQQVGPDREWITDVLGPGDCFGLEAVYALSRRVATAAAVSDTRLSSVSSPDLTRWLRRRPARCLALLRALECELRRADVTMADYLDLDLPARLAKALLALGDRFGVARPPVGLHVPHGLSQIELAQFVGSTRETTNKLLGEFQRQGWIDVGARSVVLLDRRALQRRADGGSSGSATAPARIRAAD